MSTWCHLLNDLIAFCSTDGFTVARIPQILYCEADGGYTVVVLHNKTEILVSKNLKRLEEVLPAELFVRTHHKYLVNKLHVLRYTSNGTASVLLSNGKRIPVSTRKKQLVLESFTKV